MNVKNPLLAILFAIAVSACAPQNEETDPIIDIDAPNGATPSSTMTERLDTTVDSDCFDGVISGNWHDDPELDPSTVVSTAQSNQSEMTQTAIDTLIDITLLSDQTCSDVIESPY